MANYVHTVRTNYFRVKDQEQFIDFADHLHGESGNVRLMMRDEPGEERRFALGCDGGIDGFFIHEDDDPEDAYELFLTSLQNYVAEDDAVIILDVGNEGLKYVAGLATIVTSKEIEYLDLTEIAKHRATKMLGNSEWTTECDY